MFSKPIEIDPHLSELLEKAKHYKMTKEEKEAQRKSWVVGEMMLEHPEMTKEEAEEIYNKVINFG